MTPEEHRNTSSRASRSGNRTAAEHLCRRRRAYERAATNDTLRDDLEELVSQVAERGRVSVNALVDLEARMGARLEPEDSFFRGGPRVPSGGRDPQVPVGGLPGVSPGPVDAFSEACPLASPCTRVRGPEETGPASSHCAIGGKPLEFRLEES
ncbi:hypothetical protein [Nocardiopsis halotolerans]|uniref:hypothetical protein n=1 Tax=Nocardiopsis halotolerans TaxID=124252 RepID=UPI00034B8F2B|nr:hypothetical protein [Nocardiopsis halotolerans]